jgi:Tol biopolymer transport system component
MRASKALNNFVFIISPESVDSATCQKEIAHAARNNKRLIPIFYRYVPDKDVPTALAGINWNFFRDTDDFESTFASLVDALDTDLDWKRTHTRLLQRAKEWQAKNRNDSLLLRGIDLQDALNWLGQAPTIKKQERSELQLGYIKASQEREAGELQKARREARRLRRLSLALGALLLLVIAAAIVALVARHEAQEQRDRAGERERVATSRQVAAEALTLVDTEPEQALLLGLAAGRIAPTLEGEHAILSALEEWPQLDRIIYRGSTFVMSVAFSPDGRTLAAGTYNGGLLRFDALTGRQLGAVLTVGGFAWSVSFSPRGDVIFTGSSEGQVRMWSATSGQLLRTLRVSDADAEVRSVAVSPDGTRVAAGTNKGTALVWNVQTGYPIGPPLQIHRTGVVAVGFDRTSTALVTASMDDAVRYRNLATSQDGRSLPVHKSIGNWGIALDPAGRYLAATGRTGTVELWDLAAPRRSGPKVLAGHRGDVGELAFSPDGALLATGDEQNIYLWDVRKGSKLVRQNMSHSDVIHGLAFSPDGRMIASAGADGTVRLWKVAESNPLGCGLASTRARPNVWRSRRMDDSWPPLETMARYLFGAPGKNAFVTGCGTAPR